MKNIFTTAVIFFSITTFAQVGINNTSPKATLDITAKTTDGSKPEGLIIPQLAGDQIRTATAAGVYGSAQKGLIIYATSADATPTSATANITTEGYYFFDGTNWQKIMTGNPSNIYNSDGTLTGTRTVNTAGNALKISGGGSLIAQNDNNSGKISLNPADNSHSGYLGIFKANNTRLGYIGWDNTNLTYATENGANHIFQGGKVGIGTASPQASLHLLNSARFELPHRMKDRVLKTSSDNGDLYWAPSNTNYGAGVSTTTASVADGASTTYTFTNPKGMFRISISPNGCSYRYWQKDFDFDTTNSTIAFITGSGVGNPSGGGSEVMTSNSSYNLTGSMALCADSSYAGMPATISISGNTLTITNNSNLARTFTITEFPYLSPTVNLYTENGSLNSNRTVTQGANTLAFTSTATNGFSVDGTTLSVDAANNRVGIGTTTPASRLVLENDNNADDYDDLMINTYSTTATPSILFTQSRGTKATPANLQNGDIMGGVNFRGRANGTSSTMSTINSIYRGNGTTVLSDLNFSTSGTTKMRIDENGNVGIGTSTPNAKLHTVSGTAYGAFQIQDGSEGTGKFLSSNASGQATWVNSPLTPVIFGTLNTTGATVTDNMYLNSNITLPKGKWLIYVGLLLSGSGGSSPSATNNRWVRLTLGSNNSGTSPTVSGFNFLASSLVSGWLSPITDYYRYTFLSGVIPVEVTNSSSILYLWTKDSRVVGTDPGCVIANNGENYLFAVPAY